MKQKIVLSGLIVSVLIASAFLVSASVSEKNPVDYISSIHIADSGNDQTLGISEVQESAQLSLLTKITADQAKNLALQEKAGSVNKISLENENGNVVYSVEISNNAGVFDVKVDAGNGKVLKIESGTEGKGSSNEKEASTESENNSGNETGGINHEFKGDEGDHKD